MFKIYYKNLLDICACTIIWWLLGYGFAYGDSSGKFIGKINLQVTLMEQVNTSGFQWAFAELLQYCKWMFSRENANYIICNFSLFITGFIYPIVVH